MRLLFLCFYCVSLWASSVLPGIDVLLEDPSQIKGKRVALITNQTGVNKDMCSTFELLSKVAKVSVLFAPEHGLHGLQHAAESIQHGVHNQIPIYSLHGSSRRPQPEMLKNIDLIIYDIQCTGVRAYTYPTTLFYAMEEAAKLGIEVIVLDRPNPINGLIVDGPMLEEKWRSFIGYINVPYCHGMTIGELATFFNEEYKIGCKLQVIPMRGWSRSMGYRDTGLAWIPPSPNIPEPDTPLFFPSTGILGELSLLNIGIGFTLPFKVVGAPWIRAEEFASELNKQKLPGVHFQPFYFKPFWGLYKGLDCQGVLIQVRDSSIYKPLSVQFMLLGMLKSLYPQEFNLRLAKLGSVDLFSKANGTDAVYRILLNEKYPAWKLIELHKKERNVFLEKRKQYLLY